MNDIKVSTKMKKTCRLLSQAISIYSKDIRIEFGIKKPDMPLMKNGKKETVERKVLSNQKCISTVGDK